MVLGAWANYLIPSSAKILDVGTGTGALALMLAQNNPNRFISGIEIDKVSALEAAFNFSQSPFEAQLSLKHQDFFSFTITEKFDVVISNPPYYQNTLLGSDERVNIAKHAHTFSFSDFLSKAYQCTHTEGVIIYIFPHEDRPLQEQLLALSGWFPCLWITVFGKEDQPKRQIVLAKKQPTSIESQNFIIRNVDNSYSSEYITLTKEFHNKKL